MHVRCGFAVAAAFAVATLLPTVRARAAPADTSGPTATMEAEQLRRATIVLVGRAGESGELFVLLEEFLARSAVEGAFSRSETFDADALFAERGDDGGVRVFVVPRGERAARLYLRGPGGDRFLVRKLELPNGLDEVGRELIAQVVESSVLALLSASEGMSRDEANAEVLRDTAATDARATEPSAPAADKSAPSVAPPDERASQSAHDAVPLEVWLGGRYRATATGAELGVAHGVGLELGVGWRAPLRVRARVSAEYGLDQVEETSELELRVATHALRGGMDFGLPFARHHAVLAAASGGVDVSNVESDARAPGVSAAPPFRHVTGVVRFELRYEVVLSHVYAAAAGHLDLALIRTHYDLTEPTAVTPLAELPTARPGGSIALGAVF